MVRELGNLLSMKVPAEIEICVCERVCVYDPNVEIFYDPLQSAYS